MTDLLEAIRTRFEAQNFGDSSYDMWQWLTESDPQAGENLGRFLEGRLQELEASLREARKNEAAWMQNWQQEVRARHLIESKGLGCDCPLC